MLIRVRRGLEANRTSYTPQAAELLFTTDTKRLYVGDGVTPGGILVDLSGSGIVQTIVAGANITVDSTDPSNPIVSAVGSSVISVNGATGEVVLDADDIDDTATTNKFVTAAEKAVLADTSGENTGDQDISGIATNADNLADHEADTANPHSVTKTQVGLSDVPNTDFTSAVNANTAKNSYPSEDASKLANIEENADVTDTANVTSAGALMDSEVDNLADVKSFDPADYATAAQGAEADSAVQPGDLATVATTGAYSDLSGAPTVPTSVDDLNPSQTGNSGKFLKTDGSNATWEPIPGGGDMLAAVYDPNTKTDDAFDMDNMDEGTDTKIMTAAERSAIATNSAKVGYTDAAVEVIVEAAINAAFLASHPIGCSVVGANSGANPNTYLPGMSDTTWVRIEGRFIVGASDSDSDFDNGDTGGEKTHTLIEAEMPAHAHSLGFDQASNTSTSGGGNRSSIPTGSSSSKATTSSGSGDAHNNLPPFKAKYIWERTA